MRNALAEEIYCLAKEDARVVMLSGDIGNRLFDKYKESFPDRFFNCGVAEANMMGVAAGLALSGFRPIAYTITPFITYRCIEQIRVDVCYHNAPVIIVGVGAGLSYASLGASHHSCEDIAMMRSLPGMQVVCPADPWEVKSSLEAALHSNLPTYIRIGKKGEPKIHPSRPNLTIGHAIRIREGNDICVLSCGTVLPEVISAADNLANRHEVAIYSFHSVKPLDAELLEHVFRSYALVVTVEEHSTVGGFGSAVAEWKCDQISNQADLLRIGTKDEFIHTTQHHVDAKRLWKLDAQAISQRIADRFTRTKAVT